MVETSIISAICAAASLLLNVRNTYFKSNATHCEAGLELNLALFTMNNFRGLLARICAESYKADGYRLMEIGQKYLPLITGIGDSVWIKSNLRKGLEINLEWEGISPEVLPIYPGLIEKVSQVFNKKIEDNPTYRLLSFCRDESNITLRCCPGSYGSYYETCEGLSWEAAENISAIITSDLLGAHPKSIEDAISAIENRRDSIFELRRGIRPEKFSNRDATIGVNTLTILASRGKKSSFVLHERKGEISEALGTIHVVPAGTFQPICDDQYHHQTEFSIERTILRESAEELLNLEKYIRDHSSMDPDYVFRNNEKLKNLKELYDQGFVKTYKSGFGLDPLTLKPEFLTVQVINWDMFSDYFPVFEYNWEGRGKLYELNQSVVESAMLWDDTLPACSGCLASLLTNWEYFKEEISNII